MNTNFRNDEIGMTTGILKFFICWAERHRIRDADSRSHDALIRVYDHAGNVIETQKHKDEFKQ